MMELPEVLTIAKQLQTHVAGRQVGHVFGPTKEHKFCWYQGEPEEYEAKIKGARVQSAQGFGIYAEIVFDNNYKLCVNDGVNVRLIPEADIPKNYQLLITFEDNTALVFTVAMYGGILLHKDDLDNEYYDKSKQALRPFDKEFGEYYRKLFAESKPGLSAKAFLATEQRFPGIGNGTLQDILLMAGIHPKQKIGTLSEEQKETLLSAVITVLQEMITLGGRDTEKDIFGNPGGYQVYLSKNTLAKGCRKCGGGQIIKEAYLGGAVYYCSNCQVLK